MARASTRCRLLAAALIGALVSGCGSPEIPISGTITLDGTPVPGPGTIAFYAQPGTDSPHASAEFADGKYEIPKERGPHAGTFRVEILWPKPTGKQIPTADPGIMTEERVEAIPAKYNKDTQLQVEISPSQTVHNFDLKS